MLATASGILFAGQAALLKSSVGLLGRGPAALAESWQPYTLLVVGFGGVVFSQLAFRSGPLEQHATERLPENPLAALR